MLSQKRDSSDVPNAGGRSSVEEATRTSVSEDGVVLRLESCNNLSRHGVECNKHPVPIANKGQHAPERAALLPPLVPTEAGRHGVVGEQGRDQPQQQGVVAGVGASHPRRP